MQKQAFIIVFIGVQLFLIFFYIHHQSLAIKLSFQKQKYEKRKLELAHKKQELKQAMHACHDLAQIKEFATQANMQKITLAQIKSVPHENASS